MNYIDLFAGAGGLSEGFARQGFEAIAHVEMMQEACDTLLTRAYYHYSRNKQKEKAIYRSYLQGRISKQDFYALMPPQITSSVICETMTKESLPSIFDKIDAQMANVGENSVDLIIGGPPCQAYSYVGRSRTDMSKDPRNKLYLLYIEFLKRYQPKLFVFENVVGIKTAGNGRYFADLTKKAKEAGYQKIEVRVLKAKDYGVLQNRKREIIIGLRNDVGANIGHFPYPSPNSAKISRATISDLLNDLPPIPPGGSNNQYCAPASNYLRQTGIRKPHDILTWHLTRPIRDFDRRIYRFVIAFNAENGRNPRYNEIPGDLRTHKNLSSFLDRFKIVPANSQSCQTMVAHISKDGHYYIHPDIRQARSLSVREAARIQSFPDDFYFEGSRTSVFTQIGNAVPPLLAEAIAEAVKGFLETI